mmetsp:Transcript_9615/g.23849  ORF Transcript_9615/g.23849 Transcript_9615/m.23849 type:complete len:368 (+) Transcript_9615:440-1543(+)
MLRQDQQPGLCVHRDARATAIHDLRLLGDGARAPSALHCDAHQRGRARCDQVCLLLPGARGHEHPMRGGAAGHCHEPPEVPRRADDGARAAAHQARQHPAHRAALPLPRVARPRNARGEPRHPACVPRAAARARGRAGRRLRGRVVQQRRARQRGRRRVDPLPAAAGRRALLGGHRAHRHLCGRRHRVPAAAQAGGARAVRRAAGPRAAQGAVRGAGPAHAGARAAAAAHGHGADAGAVLLHLLGAARGAGACAGRQQRQRQQRRRWRWCRQRRRRRARASPVVCHALTRQTTGGRRVARTAGRTSTEDRSGWLGLRGSAPGSACIPTCCGSGVLGGLGAAAAVQLCAELATALAAWRVCNNHRDSC